MKPTSCPARRRWFPSSRAARPGAGAGRTPMRCIGASVVGMRDGTVGRTAAQAGHLEGVDDELGAQVISD
jgi:hypothetical protein